jgi:glutathione reductase (NADPH)
MARDEYDVIIIGAGNAGIGVTAPARKAGLKVAMIESWTLGGTCPNRGCTPKKVLVAAAHAMEEIERAKAHHITVGKPKLDWAALIDREKQMISHLPGSFAKLMEERGVEVIRGKGAFAGPNEVTVHGRTLTAKHIVVATGSKPRKLPFPGAAHMITSDDVLSERTLPGEVVFVGGGVIALEFSHVYARAGAAVTILEALPRLLPSADEDAVTRIREESERIGIKVHTGVKLQSVRRADGRLRIQFEQKDKVHELAADRVVNGAGRVANLDGLELERGKVETRNGRVLTDEFLRSTSNPSVYACGDALSAAAQLSPIATYEGRIVGRNIAEGPKHRPEYGSIPSCVFTVPALASVGVTEAKAREEGRNIEVHTNDMLDWLSSRTFAETAAYSKVILDKASDRILGAHIVGHASEEIIHTFALAMKHNIPASGIRDMVYAFPTYSADIKSMV